MRPTRIPQLLAIGALLTALVAVAGWRWQAPAPASDADLQQLVAPVALYPDQLLADVLAAATFPDQADAAEQWMRQNANLSSDQIAAAVNGMDWDDSVKALTEFPTVLAYLDENLSWTSALGDAYYNQPDDVMNAVQELRQRALANGTLRSNADVTVSNQNGLIVITPANQDNYYVPMYVPWTVYGFGIAPWPGWVYPPGFVVGVGINWGLGFRWGGAWSHFGWGAPHWGFDWRNHRLTYASREWISRSPTMIRRPAPAPPRQTRVPQAPNRPPQTYATPHPVQAAPRPPANQKAVRGFPQARPAAPPAGTRSSAFSGFNRGGAAASHAARGAASMGAPRAAAPPAGGGRGRGHV